MRYRIFGRRTGLRVSELALGAGNFGTRWGHGAERAEAKKVFDAYVEAGGNFIDTADTYQFGESEELVGDFIAADRDYFVLATKYTLGTTATDGISRTGNSRKNMVRSVEGSLKRLKTDRIDLYWAHFADGMTPMEEIVRALRRSGARRQDSLCRLVQLSRLADFSRRSVGANCAAGRRSPASRSNTAWRSARRIASFCRWPKRWGWEPRCGRRSAADFSPANIVRATRDGSTRCLAVLVHTEKTARETRDSGCGSGGRERSRRVADGSCHRLAAA